MRRYIVVTGGAGYIGSHTIIEIFQNTTYEVISIDNFSNSYEDVYERIHQITNKKVISLNIDLCNKDNLFQQLKPFAKDIQGIIHFAAYKSVPESV
jgi:UDP-glucose 4-epimerase